MSIGHLPIGAFSTATQKDIQGNTDYRGINFGKIYTASVSTAMVPGTKAPVGSYTFLAPVLWIVSLVMGTCALL